MNSTVLQVDDAKIARLARDWSEIAGEPVKVEMTGGVFYGFCSELGALRLAYKYRLSDQSKHEAKFSRNLGTWFFSLEPRF